MDGGAFIVEKGAASKNLKEVQKGWDIIKRNSNRLRELVLEILLYSRPKKPEYKPSDINQICIDIEELLSKNAKENNVEIKLFLDRSIKDFYFDPKGIHRCLLNLISNAVYACIQKGSGRVNVTTTLRESSVLEIMISDNGIGISKENLEHVFDIFFTTKGTSGTGLGLAVTKKIIEEHNGTIAVSSTLNIGTRFIITLPNRNYEQ
ncbi:MAG: HAMP domain-containing histidine kinase [Ignavibacteriales bacterium]|nr:HAMP domain-containing histidine kinase [Ignavibacteriales bacterium]